MKRRSESSFVLFDVFYVDGTRSSRRKVPSSAMAGLDGGEEQAKAVLAAQDREIGLASGRPRGDIKSITRSAV